MPFPSIALDSFATFGDLLKFLRRRARLTQLELSIAVGYGEAQISRLEKNIRLPDLTALKALFVPALHLENESEIVTRLIALAESARQEDAPLPGFVPYKGLLFFDEADADWFFGREALTARLVERVNVLASHCPRLLAIFGASGSGKSSIVRAGLSVTLKRAGWDARVFTPTAQPLKTLEANLERDTLPLLLIVDQFEEVFTLCRDETARAAFIEKLLTVAKASDNGIAIVLALRADFYSHCAQYPQLRQAIAAQQEYIGQMTREELRRAIEEPAKRGGWEFEPGLVDLMLSDVGAGGAQDQEPGALPLLSHALLATWEHRRGRTFTLAGYRAAGGVQRAIAETAESVFTDQLNQAQQHLARDIFLRLTELGEGTEDTRRRANLTELVPRAEEAAHTRAVLNTLADARLVMLGEDSAEVAHEALIREWSRLREWLNENRESLRLHRHLTEAAQSWDNLNRDVGELYRGVRLAQAREWAGAHSDELNELEREFLDTSQQMREREVAEREAQRQRELTAAQKLAETQTRAARQLRKRAVFLTGTVAIAIILAIIALVFAQQSNTNAERADSEQRIAFAREVSTSAVNNLNIDPERSILLALEAVSASTSGGKPALLEAEEALHRAVLTSRVRLTLRGHTAPLNGIAYSPNGQRLATVSNDATAKVWDATNGQLLLTLTGHTAPLSDIAFSPDGTRLATSSDDQTAKVWDSASGKELFTLRGHTDQIRKVAYSPDGKRLVSAGGRIAAAPTVDNSARVWDATTGQLILTLTGHNGSIRGIAFSPDSTRIAIAIDDGAVKIWDSTNGRVVLNIAAHNDVAYSVVFSPDGRRLATTSRDQTIKIWDISSGQLLLILYGHGSAIWVAAFDQTGTRLYTASLDGTTKVWDATTGRLILTLTGHAGAVNSLALSPDGARVATASADNTARVWDVSPIGGSEWLTLAAHKGQIHNAVYSPDGTRIASSSADKTAKIWDVATSQALLTFTGHSDQLRSIAFTPDGRRVVTSSWDRTVKVWDAATGQVLLTLSTQATPFVFGMGVALSPDGKRIATVSANNAAKIWDANTGQEMITLSGHTGVVVRLAFSPDGTHLATVANEPDRTPRIWDVATGTELLKLEGHTGGVYAVAFSPDGARIATGSQDATAKVWNAATGQLLFTLSGHTGQLNGVTFSRDGTKLATGGNDGTAKVWNVAPGSTGSQQPLTLYNFGRGFQSLTFSPDGRRLLIGDEEGILRIFALPVEDIIAIAKTRVTRALTTDECQKFLHVDKCPLQ
ncbi:MAG: helix-turn-helix domain-containing protein [Chloroflexi bacterium]|nr:helix-turn-helix domain-containing protein [Chloroflexota bacterium]